MHHYPVATYYQQRLLNDIPQQPYSAVDNQVQVPAIPVQVPLRAHLSPSTIQNVQLVPCLCPISPDNENFDKPPEGNGGIVLSAKNPPQ